MSTSTLTATSRSDSRPISVAATDLLSLVAAGDSLAFETLYRTLARACFGLARKIVVDPDLARDVVQETFIHVWVHAGRYDPVRGSASSWVLTIVHHKAVDCVRREERRRQPQSGFDLLVEIASTAPPPDESACRSDLHATIRRMLATLPAGQRRALVLAYLGGYTYAEVALQLGIPLGTVKSRCGAGMTTLRHLLVEAGHTEAG